MMASGQQNMSVHHRCACLHGDPKAAMRIAWQGWGGRAEPPAGGVPQHARYLSEVYQEGGLRHRDSLSAGHLQPHSPQHSDATNQAMLPHSPQHSDATNQAMLLDEVA